MMNRDWIADAAAELAGHFSFGPGPDSYVTDEQRANVAKNYAAIIEKHCPMERDVAYMKVPLEQLKQAVKEGKFEIGNAAYHQHAGRPTEERTATVEVFDHELSAGMVISWSAKGIGFGQLTIAKRKETGEWHVDDERMSAEFCASIFRLIEARMQQ